ncbi:transporter [Acinetobacter puyangensis]|uniref:MetA-pathway of phenol degradation n=1 Tax=Acinetobacter puyangensis TaxID=1096779 RepID=A0A240EAL7_9GAMM|nr:transporter [Acinetobacter puyangensis]SNX45757.1 Putative MetA-pathway of phenol degradation [Acinetobacter puyangensis]
MISRKRRHNVFSTGISVCTLCFFAGSTHAVDLNSQDLIPAPAGTNAVLGYMTYASRDSFATINDKEIKDNTGLKSVVGIFRYVYYMDIGGFTVAPQVLLPYGRLYDGSLNNTRLESASGAADPIFAAPVWLVNNSKTNFAIVPYLYVPAGAYDAGRTLNLGENRWKFDLQLGGTQQLGGGFTAQVSADVMWYGDNKDAINNGVGRLEQDNTYQVQGWLSYTPPEDKTWTLAAGYSKYWGGKQTVDGVENGQMTKVDQLRLELSKFVAPTVQLQGQLQRDLQMEGGFKEDLRATLRIMKVF